MEGIVIIPAMITSVVLTYWYMKDKILIHSGPTSQFDAILKVWVFMMVVSAAIWAAIGWILGGVFSFIKEYGVYILGAVAVIIFFNSKNSTQNSTNESNENEASSEHTSLPESTIKAEDIASQLLSKDESLIGNPGMASSDNNCKNIAEKRKFLEFEELAKKYDIKIIKRNRKKDNKVVYSATMKNSTGEFANDIMITYAIPENDSSNLVMSKTAMDALLAHTKHKNPPNN